MTGMIDIHCHIVPGVDDGSASIEESLEMLKKSWQDGVRQMILTPHFRLGMFETRGTKIHEQYERLRAEASRVLPELKLHLGCEFHATMEQEELLQSPRFFLAGTRNLLLEFSGGDTENFIRDRIRSAQMLGAKVIIAHVERCRAMNLKFITEIRHLGAMIQVNADAVLGLDGRPVKRFCRKLLKEDHVDFIASDAHNLTDRASHLGECAEYVAKKYGAETAEKIFITNPSRILKQD